ncbi:Homeobox protein prospero [Papilio machaon]|uniref:Homeobox protein prospero n=1 Tax=Papilio machaon TaxID=76193 RepID=A0A194R4Z2_PAPMA|nr:Homeobox protein prospero [Papilio machaon]
MHLRKAKLMFFWVRYPSSAVLKMYFPDIKFNKNNTAQLVKWFSNFRSSIGVVRADVYNNCGNMSHNNFKLMSPASTTW